MSLTREDQKATTGAEQHSERAQERSTGMGGENQQQQQSRPAGGLFNLNSSLRRAIGRSSAGEEVSKYAQALRETLKLEDESGDSGLQIHVLDGSAAQLAISSILVTMSYKSGGQVNVGVFTLMVEASISGRLANRQVNYNGRNIEVTTVPGDLYDEFYQSNVVQTVREKFGADAKVHAAGFMVVPNETSVEDKNRVRGLLFVANNALTSTMSAVLDMGEAPFTISMIDQSVALNANLEYDVHNDEDITGMPVRSDIRLTLQGVSRNGPQAHHERMLDLTKVNAFVDLVYDAHSADQQQSNMFGFAQPQQPQQTQHFYPRCVITGNDSQVDATTPELQLLALATSTILSKNMAWAGVFIPNYSAGKVDLRDLGGVGYEINLTGDPNAKPQPIDTKSDKFTREHLGMLIQTLIHDKLIYSMDVEEAGELSWAHSIFMGAALNKPGAIRAIVQTADNLTNGYFSRRFQTSQPIVVDDNNRIHLGYWSDENGTKRDLREIDYLAMINWVGAKDMALVRQFADTFDRVDLPIEVRLEERERIYSAVLGNSYKIKGMARRVTFSPAFMLALQQACEDAGLVVRPGNVSQDFGKMGVRGSTSAADFAVGGMTGSMFQSGQSGFSQFRSATGWFPNNNRWS